MFKLSKLVEEPKITDHVVRWPLWMPSLNHCRIATTIRMLLFHQELRQKLIEETSDFSISHALEKSLVFEENELCCHLNRQHSPDPGKVESIKNISVPTTKKEIRSFQSLTSYYREYIPHFASLVLPLTELTKNRVPNIIPWNEVTKQVFTKLKAQLVKAPSLNTPNLSKPYQLYTDASATAIGACLSQNDEKGKDNPIAFFSKKLTETQTRWATIEREAYAVIEALKRFDS
ncbi:retrovirus-related Pol polyprotein from transposon opus [Trichonephila clavipes]|nr:retrovirus-related Pol polyprotein from transposon opus [Trichonephila clavipes]